MGGSCEKCNHRCCVNGESGVSKLVECSKCGEYIQLCSNYLTNQELEQRCNGEACGCGDNIDEETFLCENCENCED